jgi:hypothetical protein
LQSVGLAATKLKAVAMAQAFADSQSLAGIVEAVVQLASREHLLVALHCQAARFAVRLRQVVPRKHWAFAIQWK